MGERGVRGQKNKFGLYQSLTCHGVPTFYGIAKSVYDENSTIYIQHLSKWQIFDKKRHNKRRFCNSVKSGNSMTGWTFI